VNPPHPDQSPPERSSPILLGIIAGMLVGPVLGVLIALLFFMPPGGGGDFGALGDAIKLLFAGAWIGLFFGASVGVAIGWLVKLRSRDRQS
jgi:hypothetical protein